DRVAFWIQDALRRLNMDFDGRPTGDGDGKGGTSIHSASDPEQALFRAEISPLGGLVADLFMEVAQWFSGGPGAKARAIAIKQSVKNIYKHGVRKWILNKKTADHATK